MTGAGKRAMIWFCFINDAQPSQAQKSNGLSNESLQSLQPSRSLRPAGVEPTTFGSGGQRSIQLSYGRDESRR